MTPDEFREIALGFPEAEERSHMDHPDFRVSGKIFATIGYPNTECGMAALLPAEQQEFIRIEPASFKPAPGVWGVRGATIITLSVANEDSVRQALAAAWRNTAPKTLLSKINEL